MKKITPIIASILISYLFNAYAYNSFNSANFPIEAKYLSSFGVLLIIVFTLVVKDEVINDQTDKINKLQKELDKLKTN